MNHSVTKANGVFFAWQRADQIYAYQKSVHGLCMVHRWREIFKILVNKNSSALSSYLILPPILYSPFLLLPFPVLCIQLIILFSYFFTFTHLTLFSHHPLGFFLLVISFSNNHSPPPLASDMASDQGQVLVIVTAAVGGFTLLVILTLFLLITGR